MRRFFHCCYALTFVSSHIQHVTVERVSLGTERTVGLFMAISFIIFKKNEGIEHFPTVLLLEYVNILGGDMIHWFYAIRYAWLLVLSHSIPKRIAKASAAFGSLRLRLWNNHHVCTRVKGTLQSSCPLDSSVWTVYRQQVRKLHAFMTRHLSLLDPKDKICRQGDKPRYT